MHRCRLLPPALFLLPALLLGCADDGSGPLPARVATVVVAPDSAGLLVGETLTLSATALSGEGDTLAAGISWASSAPAVVDISVGGQALALAPGRAEVTASGGNAAGTAVVTVQAAPTLTVSPRSATIFVGGLLQLHASVLGAADAGVTWLSSDTVVARVGSDGMLFGTSTGTARIHARLTAHPAVRDSAVLTVVTGTLAPRIEPSNPTLVEGDTLALQAVNFAGPVTWESSSASVATVDSVGLLRAVAAGSAIVTARSSQSPNIVASTTVTVTPRRSVFSIARIEGPNGEAVDLQSLSGDIAVVVNVEAPASSGAAEVTVLVDGAVAARRGYGGGAEQWRAPVDTRAWANGSHQIRAQLLNASGDVIASVSGISVVFAN